MKPETMEKTEDILREMRQYADKQERMGIYDLRDLATETLRVYADRIQAAHKQEVADALNTGASVEATRKHKNELVTDCNDLNAAKCREALVAIDKNTDLLDIAENIAPKLHPSHSFVAVQIRKIVCTALSAPPRNCDVGTAEEQVSRWMRFCTPRSCAKCPVYQKSDGVNCHFVWLQMPYTKESTE